MRINFRRVFIITSILASVISYGFLWVRMITTPVEYTGADFIAFYAAGRIAQNEGASSAYDLSLQHHYEQEVVGFPIDPLQISPYLRPPYLLPLVRLLAIDNFVLSFVLWNLFMLPILGLGTVLLTKQLRPFLNSSQVPILLGGLFIFFPGFVGLINGQDNAILYLGACAWLAGLLTGKDWLAGLGLALMTLRPHLVLPLALPFVFRQRRVWWWFLLGVACLAGISLACASLDGVLGYLRIILVSSGGDNYHTGENHMFNLIGILLRIFPNISPASARLAGWAAYLVVMVALCVIWKRNRQLDEKHFGLAVILVLLSSPHTHVHDLILLSIPLIGFMRISLRETYLSVQDNLLLPYLLSMGLFFGFFAEFLKYTIPYIFMLLLTLPVWFPKKFFRRLIVAEE